MTGEAAEGVETYYNSRHNVSFDIPYRWAVTEAVGKQFGVIIEPDANMEHNVQAQIEQSGFIPKVVVTAEPRDPREDAGVSPAFFSVQGGEDPKILGNYVFESDDGRKAHLITTTQELTRHRKRNCSIQNNTTHLYQFRVTVLYNLCQCYRMV